MFIVPMTLFSCALAEVVVAESTTRRVSTTVSISAASTTRRSRACWAPTFTYSVRSSSTVGSSLSTPIRASTSGNASSALARRPPQYVEMPVTRIRFESTPLPEPDRLALGEHVPETLLDAGADLVRHRLHERLVLVHPLLVEVDWLEEAQLELRRQEAGHAEQAEVRERRRDREVEEPREPLHDPDLREHRRGLLGSDDADRHDRCLRPHRGLYEAAAAEAAQAVAVLVELLGGLAALREDQHELLLVVEQAVHVRRVGRHAADLRQQRAEARIALEEVLDGDVHRPRVGVLLADRLRDHRRVRGQRAGVVRDEQRAAARRHVLDPLHLGAEPVAVEEVGEGAVPELLDALGAAPVVEMALGLDPGEVRLELLCGDERGGRRLVLADREGCALAVGHGRRFKQARSRAVRGRGRARP